MAEKKTQQHKSPSLCMARWRRNDAGGVGAGSDGDDDDDIKSYKCLSTALAVVCVNLIPYSLSLDL